MVLTLKSSCHNSTLKARNRITEFLYAGDLGSQFINCSLGAFFFFSFFFFQLQDRTQFSDRDLATLKKFWDNGMTSLGSVCREKITAVATELNVDCEIIKVRGGGRRGLFD